MQEKKVAALSGKFWRTYKVKGCVANSLKQFQDEVDLNILLGALARKALYCPRQC